MENNNEERFYVRFRGVRGSYPVANKSYLKYGGNTACVEIRCGEHLIVIDAGTGLINLGEDLMREHLASGTDMYDRKPVEATILLSHIHQDHIQGFTFFKPSHIASTKLNVFGAANYNDNLADELAQLLFTKSFPLDLGDIAANLNIYDISNTDYIIIDERGTRIRRIEKEEDLQPKNNEVIISSYKSYAHPQDGVLIFKISYKGKSVVYASDKESYTGGDKKLALFARGCDLLIHDAQYSSEDYLNPFLPKQGYGHSTFEMALEMKKDANAKKMAFFHFDPEYDDEKLEEIGNYYKSRENGVFLAYEGLETEI